MDIPTAIFTGALGAVCKSYQWHVLPCLSRRRRAGTAVSDP
jgi:hypothetical protein